MDRIDPRGGTRRVAKEASMSKRNRRNKNVGGGAEDTSSIAKAGAPDAEANTNLADFAKAQAKKEEAKKAAEPKINKDGRVKLPALPRSASKQKPEVDCACGCGSKTRSTFFPGHDSRLKGWALRIARNVLTLDDMVEKFKCADGERTAVAAYIKQLKKEGKWEALKLPQTPAPKPKPVAAGE